MNNYINEAFSRENANTNLEVNNLNVNCITSINNNFNLDSDGNLTVKSINVETGVVTNSGVLNLIYPVGSIYLSVNNVNPGSLFGGTWEQIKDRFLLASGDNYEAGVTGGEVTHELTVDEMPSHNHNVMFYWSNIYYPQLVKIFAAENCQSYGYGQNTENTGGNQPHNNMPPYLTVYIWKRIS